MFRSTIAPAKREANAATTISVQTVERDRCGDEGLHARLQRADPGREQQERGERDHGDVEVELGKMPEEVPEHVDDVVALLADDLVGAEEARDRRAARQLRAEHEHGAAGDDAVERRHGRSGLRATSRSRSGAVSAARTTAMPCTRTSVTTPHAAEQDELAPQRRLVERAQERPRREQERGIERVLGHQRAGVGERRERDREQRGEQRQARSAAAAARSGRRESPPATSRLR